MGVGGAGPRAGEQGPRVSPVPCVHLSEASVVTPSADTTLGAGATPDFIPQKGTHTGASAPAPERGRRGQVRGPRRVGVRLWTRSLGGDGRRALPPRCGGRTLPAHSLPVIKGNWPRRADRGAARMGMKQGPSGANGALTALR